MTVIPARYAPQVYSIFRAVIGFLFMCHGLGKMFGLFDTNIAQFGTLRWVAGMLELTLGAFIMGGLFTAVAAFLASGEMAVAYFRSHQPEGLLPIQNGGGLATAYCFAFLFMAAYGSGPWSLDALIRRKA